MNVPASLQRRNDQSRCDRSVIALGRPDDGTSLVLTSRMGAQAREATTIPRATRASNGLDIVILVLREELSRTQVYDGCPTDFNPLDEQ